MTRGRLEAAAEYLDSVHKNSLYYKAMDTLLVPSTLLLRERPAVELLSPLYLRTSILFFER